MRVRAIRYIFAVSSIILPAHTFAFNLGDLIPKNINDLIPVGGALLGAGACNHYFKGKNQAIATAVCGAAGAWLGVKLKNYLNEREQAQLAEATYKTVDTGQKQTVTSERGTTITTEVVGQEPVEQSPPKGKKGQAAKPPTAAPSETNPECSTVRQTIVLPSGERQQEDLTVCKKDGKWVPQTN